MIKSMPSKLIMSGCSCPKMLIVDDEPFNLIVLEGLLEKINIPNVDKTFNGKEALDLIKRNIEPRHLWGQAHQPYKLVMTDNQMPILSGVETAKELKLWQD